MKHRYTLYLEDMAIDEYEGTINGLALDYFLNERGWKIRLSPEQIENTFTDMVRVEEPAKA